MLHDLVSLRVHGKMRDINYQRVRPAPRAHGIRCMRHSVSERVSGTACDMNAFFYSRIMRRFA